MAKFHSVWYNKRRDEHTYFCGGSSYIRFGNQKRCYDCDALLVTRDDLLSLDRLREPTELAEYAAEKAASELVDNWMCALRDGADLDDLVNDVARVTNLLTEWRVRLSQSMKDREVDHG